MSQQKNPKPASPVEPVREEFVLRFRDGLKAADFTVLAFTKLELDTLRSICRDSDNENAIRFLQAALARAGAK